MIVGAVQDRSRCAAARVPGARVRLPPVVGRRYLGADMERTYLSFHLFMHGGECVEDSVWRIRFGRWKSRITARCLWHVWSCSELDLIRLAGNCPSRALDLTSPFSRLHVDRIVNIQVQ